MAQFGRMRLLHAYRRFRLTMLGSLAPHEGAHADLWSDLRTVWRYRDFCITLAFQKSVARYRSSLIGPVWIALTFAIFVLGLGIIWSVLFNIDFARYLPYVTVGMFVWNFLTGVITDSARALQENKPTLLHSRTVVALYPVVAVLRQGIIAAHNIPFVAVVLFLYAGPSAQPWLAMAGVAMILIVAVGVAIALSVICVYIPDLSEIIASVLRFGFFFTPILWFPSDRAWLEFVWMSNPFYHLVEVVRGPLLSHSDFVLSFYVVGSIAVLVWIAAMVTYWRAAGAATTRL